MNIIDRIANIGRAQLQPAQGIALPSTPADQRLLELADELAQAEADAQATVLRRQAAYASAAKLTEQAAVGTLDDPARLVNALQLQRELAAQTPATDRLAALRVEQAQLQEQVHVDRRKAAEGAYAEAVVAYARACTPLLALAQRVRDLAPAAGVLLNDFNSPHLLWRTVTIGGAVVDIPAEAAEA